MEATGRDVNLAVEAQPFSVLYHFPSPLQAGFQMQASNHVIADVDHPGCC